MPEPERLTPGRRIQRVFAALLILLTASLIVWAIVAVWRGIL